MLQGAYGYVKHIWGVFLAGKTRKDTTWSVPKCFLDVQSCITVIQWYIPSFDVRNNVHRRASPWKRESLSQLVATMMYDVVL